VRSVSSMARPSRPTFRPTKSGFSVPRSPIG
jgi:hypothetical protein